jgi:hypothetical protein
MSAAGADPDFIEFEMFDLSASRHAGVGSPANAGPYGPVRTVINRRVLRASKGVGAFGAASGLPFGSFKGNLSKNAHHSTAAIR